MTYERFRNRLTIIMIGSLVVGSLLYISNSYIKLELSFAKRPISIVIGKDDNNGKR